MIFEVKGKKLIPKSERPKAIGSVWVGEGKFMHGPRQKNPKQFSKIYLLPPSRFKDVPKDTKLVVAGTLKSGKMAVQSYLRPIPNWVKVQRSKLMKSKKGKIFRKKEHVRKKSTTTP